MDIVPDLTTAEKQYLKDYMSSELMRVIKKALSHYKMTVYQKLLQADRDHLPIVQGELRGLQAALNIIDIKAAQAKAPEEDTPQSSYQDAKPLVQAKDRV